MPQSGSDVEPEEFLDEDDDVESERHRLVSSESVTYDRADAGSELDADWVKDRERLSDMRSSFITGAVSSTALSKSHRHMFKRMMSDRYDSET